MRNENCKTEYYVERRDNKNWERNFIEKELVFSDDNQAIEYFIKKYSVKNKESYILYKAFLNAKLNNDIVDMRIIKTS